MEQEPSPSLEELQQRVENGGAQAMYELGWHYLFGPEETRDLDAGFRLVEKAVELGVDAAIYTLGFCYYSGLGTVPDLKKTVALYWQAVEHNDPIACAGLGALYYYGWGVPRDHKTAALLVHKAAEHGIEEAKVLLGRCFFFGEGTRKNRPVGRRLIAEVEQSSQTSPGAWYELGNFYAQFFGKQNQRKTMEFYQKAADAGLIDAWTQIACIHFKAKEFTKALEILNRPDMADIPGAKMLLARCYAQGLGVEKKLEEAARLYRSDAESGSPDAEYEWGCILDRGKYGIPQDRNEADKWLNITAKKDYIWTKKKDDQWILLTCAAFGFYWLLIPCLFAFLILSETYETSFDLLRNLLDKFEVFILWLPVLLLFFLGAFKSLRCARWGSVLMAFVSVDMAIWILFRVADGKSVGIWLQCIFGLGIPLLISMFACVGLAKKIYWLERKLHERRISFKTPILIGAAVLILFHVLRYFVVEQF